MVERIRKETLLAVFAALHRHLLAGTEENHDLK
jgi:hypothetical protein